MSEHDQHRDDAYGANDVAPAPRRILTTGFVATIAMAVAALLTPPLFLS